MGQGIRTSVAMIVADDLDADWSKVTVEQALGDEKTYGSQNTNGSRSVRDFYTALREAGATGRALLEAAAAKEWNVPVSEVEAREHVVTRRPSGRKLNYGELVATARDLPMPEKTAIRLKQPEQFRFIGKDLPIVDMADMITGAAEYGMDLRRDGLLVAVIARPPVYGVTVKSVDSSAAEKVSGVESIVRLDSTPPPSGFMPLGGVAVLARSTWAAMQGQQQLKVVWEHGPHATYDSAVFRTELERSVRRPGKVVRTQGDAARALSRASKRLQADYYVPHLSHAQMEPLAALATFENGKCDIWAPSPAPPGGAGHRCASARYSGRQRECQRDPAGRRVRGQVQADFIVEAALLARETGQPVKVVGSAVAPALCNAIFAATGRRIRNLPVGKQLAGGIASA